MIKQALTDGYDFLAEVVAFLLFVVLAVVGLVVALSRDLLQAGQRLLTGQVSFASWGKLRQSSWVVGLVGILDELISVYFPPRMER